MKKVLSLLLVLAVMVFLFASCAAPAVTPSLPAQQSPSAAQTSAQAQPSALQEASASQTEKTGKKLKIGISVNALSAEHNRLVFEGTQAAAKAAGHEVFPTNANGTAAQQTTDIENLIQQECDVIIIQNGDTDGLRNVVQEAKSKGIYTISMESGWIPGASSMFALNDFAIGATVYQLLAAEMGFEGEVICVNHNDHPAIRARRNIQEAILKEYTSIKNVTTVTSGYPGTTENTYKGVESALQAHPNVKAIWTTFGLETQGALQACQALGKNDIIMIAVDGDQNNLKEIKEGKQIIADVVGDQEWAIKESIKVAEKLAAGEKVQAFYPIPFTVVTKANVDQFYKP